MANEVLQAAWILLTIYLTLWGVWDLILFLWCLKLIRREYKEEKRLWNRRTRIFYSTAMLNAVLITVHITMAFNKYLWLHIMANLAFQLLFLSVFHYFTVEMMKLANKRIWINLIRSANLWYIGFIVFDLAFSVFHLVYNQPNSMWDGMMMLIFSVLQFFAVIILAGVAYYFQRKGLSNVKTAYTVYKKQFRLLWIIILLFFVSSALILAVYAINTANSNDSYWFGQFALVDPIAEVILFMVFHTIAFLSAQTVWIYAFWKIPKVKMQSSLLTDTLSSIDSELKTWAPARESSEECGKVWMQTGSLQFFPVEESSETSSVQGDREKLKSEIRNYFENS